MTSQATGTGGVDERSAVMPRLRVPRIRAVARGRVDGLFDCVWEHRLTLVVAPAGSGKTTAMAQLCGRAPYPVGWYRAAVGDAAPDRFLSCIRLALTPHLPLPEAQSGGAEGLCMDLESALDRVASPVALVIDDLHALRATAAMAALGQLLENVPSQLCLVVATRAMPDLDLTPLMLRGEMLQIGSEELRFRTWETEMLFRDLYRMRLAPDDLARLTQRVGGWPAGLRLYQLAANGKTAAEQRHLVDVLNTRSWAMRDYLTRNMLDTLRPELRAFLLETSVLGSVTASLADELRGRNDSDHFLQELESLDLLAVPLDDTGTYHYHEVLRTHVETVLLHSDRPAALRVFRRAGELLEAHGWLAEALRCFGRAEAWDAVARVVGSGASVVTASSWLDTLTEAMVATDPWLMLARARGRVGVGKLADALDAYRSAEALGEGPAFMETCRRERAALTTWLEPSAPPRSDWMGRLRSATRRDPLRAFEDPLGRDPHLVLGAGVAALVALDLERATSRLEVAATLAPPGSIVSAAAQLALAVAGLLGSGDDDAGPVELAERIAERADAGWLARVARSALVLTNRGRDVQRGSRVAERFDADGDPWGAALALLFDGWRAVREEQDGSCELTQAAERFRLLGASVLEAQAQALFAICAARAQNANAREIASAAERLAHSVRSPGARALAMHALEIAAPTRTPQASATLRACGVELASRSATAGVVVDVEPAASIRRIELLGCLRVIGDEGAVELSSVRPRARSLLRLLSLHEGRFVHREALLDALWPDTHPDAATRNLHTAVSSLRQALGPHGFTIDRDADSYRIGATGPLEWDVAEFEEATASARQARAAGRSADARAHFRRALVRYKGELLPEEGPSEWVVARRDQLRIEAVAVAVASAELALESGRADEAVDACERAIALDSYADAAWRLLILAFDRSGSVVSAIRSRQAYLEVQQRLGIH